MKRLRLPSKLRGIPAHKTQVLKVNLASHLQSGATHFAAGTTQRKHAAAAVVSKPVPNQPWLTINENYDWECTSLRCRTPLIFPQLLTFAQNPKAPCLLFMEVCWIYGQSGAVGELPQWRQIRTCMHTFAGYTHVNRWIRKKNTSDSSMKPAAAARVTALTLLQGFKRNNQNVAKWKKRKVSWKRVHFTYRGILCWWLEKKRTKIVI